MATVILAAVSAICEIALGQHHQTVLEIEIDPFDKALIFFSYGIRSIFLHRPPETPCYPLPRVSVIR